MGMPAEVKAKIDALKASVRSGVRHNPDGSQKVRAASGDRVLLHDGVTVIAIRDISPLEAMIVPVSLTVFVGNKGEIQAEIARLGLENNV
jgi:hypothetical protein